MCLLIVFPGPGKIKKTNVNNIKHEKSLDTKNMHTVPGRELYTY